MNYKNSTSEINNIDESKSSNYSKFVRVIGNLRLLFFLIAIITMFSIINPNYFSVNSFFSILMSITVVGLVCIGQTLCLLTGGFDLSVGSVVLISGVTAAYIIRNFSINVWVAFLIVIIVGLLIGLLNGIIIIKGGINPLIATLAMSSILTGLAYFLTRGSFINVKEEAFRFLGTGRLFGLKFLQIPIIIVIVFYFIFFIILKYTYYGKYIYLVGGNREAAKFSGINVNVVGISVYVLSGLLAGVGGYILASRVGSAQPTVGMTFVLNSIAAVILGGVSLSGGKGSVLGSLIGILILQSLSIGLLAIGLNPYFQDIASGMVLLVAVFLDVFRKK